MIAPPPIANESARLRALHALKILDTPAEERFDRITRLLAKLLDAPIALVSLVDGERQWFKSRCGLSIAETPRDQAFCAHAIVGSETFVVPDATRDERFHDNPLVTSDPNIRFYAGHPIQGAEGHHVGTLCVIDDKPRELSERDAAILRDLAAVVERELQLTEISALQQQVIESQQAVEKLLLSILPSPVVARLREGPRMVADHYPAVTVLFADCHGFSRVAATTPPQVLVEWLNSVFTACDQLAAHYGLEKIKTIGDAYMAVCGLPEPRDDHVSRAAAMALRMRRETAMMLKPDGTPLQVRIGIHTGPVIAGVVGTSRIAYDLWGNTVNIAAQLESSAAPGTIHVSEAVERALRGRFAFEADEKLRLKGGGELETYRLEARNPS